MASILVVDDRAPNRDYLATVLGYYGHTVAEAADGVEALASIRQARPALVITDLLMPNMDGEELARHLRDDPLTKDLPVIFYTAAYFAREAGEIAARVGVRWVQPKPSEPQAIMDVVGKALGIPQVLAQPAQRWTTEPGDADTSQTFQGLSQRLDQLLDGVTALTGAQDKPPEVLDVLHSVHGLGLRLASLVKLGMESASERNPASLADLFCGAAQDILSARYVGVVMLEPQSGALSHFAARGLNVATQAAVAADIAQCSAARRVLADRHHVRLLVAAQQGDETGLPGAHPPVGNFLACAVLAREEASGWMYVAERLGGQGFTADDERVIRALAGQLGAAWESVMLYAQLDRRVAERTRALELANKELESFSYSVSHDLRGPLQSISGFAAVLQRKFADTLPPDAQRYLGLVQRNALRMETLIEELLRLSRLGHQPLGKIKPVSMQRLARECLDELAPEINRRAIEVVLGELPDAPGSATLLRQVLANLLGNAVKYTRHQPRARVQIGCEPLDGEQVYFVRDNGAGFDMQYADSLFGVFRRLHTDEQFEGTGIGLATVQRIVSRHGGRIWAKAAVDKGATFFFTLGEAAPPPGHAEPA
jgi:signal transduction histidine kinase/DNA-binding NarL/FixJ family response regulator